MRIFQIPFWFPVVLIWTNSPQQHISQPRKFCNTISNFLTLSSFFFSSSISSPVQILSLLFIFCFTKLSVLIYPPQAAILDDQSVCGRGERLALALARENINSVMEGPARARVEVDIYELQKDSQYDTTDTSELMRRNWSRSTQITRKQWKLVKTIRIHVGRESYELREKWLLHIIRNIQQ